MKSLRPLLLASSLATLGTSVSADTDVATVSNCGEMQMGNQGRAVAVCDVRNHSEVPIATIEAVILLKSPKGAAVTRHQDRFEVPGGIAGGGMGWVSFPHAENAAEFVDTPFKTEVQIIQVLDYDGQPVRLGSVEAAETRAELQPARSKPVDEKLARIKSEVEEMQARMKSGQSGEARKDRVTAKNGDAPAPVRTSGKIGAAESERLAHEIKSCWKVNPRSEIAQVDLVVTFDLDEDAQLKGDVEVVRATDYDERVVWDAYLAVRRAVLRCQGDGFSLQGPVHGIKMQFVDGATARVVG